MPSCAPQARQHCRSHQRQPLHLHAVPGHCLRTSTDQATWCAQRELAACIHLRIRHTIETAGPTVAAPEQGAAAVISATCSAQAGASDAAGRQAVPARCSAWTRHMHKRPLFLATSRSLANRIHIPRILLSCGIRFRRFSLHLSFPCACPPWRAIWAEAEFGTGCSPWLKRRGWIDPSTSYRWCARLCQGDRDS